MRFFYGGLLAAALLLAVPSPSVAGQQPVDSPPPQQDPAAAPPADTDQKADPPPQPAGVGTPPATPADQPDAPADAPTGAPTDPEKSTPPEPPTVGGSQQPVYSSRPFSGLFGGAAPVASKKHALDLSASVFAVHASGDTVGQPVEGDVLANGSTTYGGSSALLTYRRQWNEATVGADGAIGVAYIPDNEDVGGEVWPTRWDVGANASFSHRLSRRWYSSGAGRVDYSPYFQQDLLFQPGVPSIQPPAISTPGLDFTLLRDPSIQSQVDGSLSYELTRNSRLQAYGHLNRRDFVSSDTAPYYDSIVGGRYTYQINRYVGLRAGYGYRTARYGGPDDVPLHSHELDAGADGGYGHSYALARRTTFSFNTGSSIFVGQRTTTNNGQSTDNAHFIVSGTAELVHGWARTWSASVGARRGIDYEFGFAAPIISNSTYAGVGGLLAHNLDFSATATYTSGNVGFGAADNGFATYAATSNLRYALSRKFAAYAQYFYYHYDFGQDVSLPPYLRPGMTRNGVSVGLTTWISLIGSRGHR